MLRGKCHEISEGEQLTVIDHGAASVLSGRAGVAGDTSRAGEVADKPMRRGMRSPFEGGLTACWLQTHARTIFSRPSVTALVALRGSMTSLLCRTMKEQS